MGRHEEYIDSIIWGEPFEKQVVLVGEIIVEMACLDFLNSEFRDFRGRWQRDDLLNPAWLQAFLARWDLEIDVPSETAPLGELEILRATMTRIVEAIPMGKPAPEDLNALNAVLHQAPSTMQLSWDGQEFRLEALPLKKDWQWVMAEIAGSFTDLLVHHDKLRVKVCENPNCRWIFYDESKSRTKRWCTNDKCANLWKVRRFRERHKEEVHLI